MSEEAWMTTRARWNRRLTRKGNRGGSLRKEAALFSALAALDAADRAKPFTATVILFALLSYPHSLVPNLTFILMSVSLLPVIPRRSSSLPISPDAALHERPCCPSRHGSTVMVVSDSSSPPSSPRQVLIRPELTVDDSQPPPYSAKDPDHSPCISPPRSPPHSLSESAPDQDMDIDRDDVLPLPPPIIPVKPPVPTKLLDDEEEHLHRSLRLQDFELRGTLGTSCCLSSGLLYNSLIYLFQERAHSGASSLSSTVLHRLHQPIQPGFLQ